jgi:hypothetical protein
MTFVPISDLLRENYKRPSRMRFLSAASRPIPLRGVPFDFAQARLFDCAPGRVYLAGSRCGGASLRMTHLFLWLGFGAAEAVPLQDC